MFKISPILMLTLMNEVTDFFKKKEISMFHSHERKCMKMWENISHNITNRANLIAIALIVHIETNRSTGEKFLYLKEDFFISLILSDAETRSNFDSERHFRSSRKRYHKASFSIDESCDIGRKIHRFQKILRAGLLFVLRENEPHLSDQSLRPPVCAGLPRYFHIIFYQNDEGFTDMSQFT